jgi:pilus assembly protein Flp/PilA
MKEVHALFFELFFFNPQRLLITVSLPLRGLFMFKSFASSLFHFVKDEDGPTAVEYAVMLALIIVVCITAITTLGSNANNTFSYVGTSIAGS